MNEYKKEDNHTSFDVLIVGAGPAGAAAAIMLSKQQLKVGLIDSVNEVKPKVGESLLPAVLRLLKRLQINGIPDLLSSDDYKPCMVNASAWGQTKWQYRDHIFNPEGNGWHVNRTKFDKALRTVAEEAGASFIDRRIVNITKTLDGYELGLTTSIATGEKKLKAKYVIDATGRAAKISRLLGHTRTIVSHQMACIAWLKETVTTDAATRIKSVANGWWYTAVLPNKLRVAVFHGLKNQVIAYQKNASQFVTAFNHASLLTVNVEEDNLAYPLKVNKANVEKQEKPLPNHVIAVGDAVLSFDPLASQGVFFALYSGIQAGELILKMGQNVQSDWETLITAYHRQVENVFQANQKSRAYFYYNERRFWDNPYWVEARLQKEKSAQKYHQI